MAVMVEMDNGAKSWNPCTSHFQYLLPFSLPPSTSIQSRLLRVVAQVAQNDDKTGSFLSRVEFIAAPGDGECFVAREPRLL